MGLLRLGLVSALLIAGSPSHAVSFGDVAIGVLEQLAANDRSKRRAQARAPRSDTLWLIVASRQYPEEAVQLAESYASTLGPMLVMQSRNGRYAVIAGTLNRDKSKSNLETLKGLRLVPGDSFLTDGANLGSVIWHSYEPNSSLDLMTQPAYRQSVRRLQAAFSRLDIYDGPIDGLIGPSTSKAFAAYVAGFGAPGAEVLDEYSLASIEQTAADGFRNEEERRIAQERGFADAASFAEANAGGFPSANVFNQARTLGLPHATRMG